MPIFEYKCADCGTKFEVLHKSLSNLSDTNCPKCQSLKAEKLFSAFAANSNTGNSFSDGCASGNCGINYPASPCAGGMCGLN